MEQISYYLKAYDGGDIVGRGTPWSYPESGYHGRKIGDDVLCVVLVEVVRRDYPLYRQVGDDNAVTLGDAKGQRILWPKSLWFK